MVGKLSVVNGSIEIFNTGSILMNLERALLGGATLLIQPYQSEFGSRFKLGLSSPFRHDEPTLDEQCLATAFWQLEGGGELLPCGVYSIVDMFANVLKTWRVQCAEVSLDENGGYSLSIRTCPDTSLTKLPVILKGRCLLEAVARYVRWTQ